VARLDEPYARRALSALYHKKWIGVSKGAFALGIKGILHCCVYRTDGVIMPPSAIRRYGGTGAEARELCQARLWDALTETRVVQGRRTAVLVGYRVHDFLKYQSSVAEIEHLRELKREAGRAGGREKAARARAQPLPLDWEVSSTVLPKVPSTLPDTVPSKLPWHNAVAHGVADAVAHGVADLLEGTDLPDLLEKAVLQVVPSRHSSPRSPDFKSENAREDLHAEHEKFRQTQDRILATDHVADRPRRRRARRGE
jgi:hypothetical protein